MNKDFMMGAELALKGMGIADERQKAELMSKITNAQLSEITRKAQNEQGFQNLAQEFSKPQWGNTGSYTPPGATPQGMTEQLSFDSPEFMQRALQFLEPMQAVSAITSMGTKETPQQRFIRDMAVAQVRSGGEKDAKFREFETVKPEWSGKKGSAEYGSAYDKWQKENLASKTKIAIDIKNASGQPGTFQPGTLDYMVEKFETDGVIPPFGMGQVGAKQRAAFFDKAAERARARGDTGGIQAVRGAEFKSSQSTLTDLTKREQLIESYNVRINETSNKVLIPLIKKWDLQSPRFANWPVNKLAELMGSGDLAALKLALNSVSVEVGKVEFNALGIQQLTDSAAKFMNSVHDPNMKVGELLKVIDTSKALGKTGSDAISNQRKGLVNRMKNIAPSSGVITEGAGQKIGRFTIEVE